MTLTYAEYLGLRRFDRLDGLRGLSILLVFTAHPVSHTLWPRFHGAAGVTIFFVLSGFLINTLLLREERKAGEVNLGSFYVRRLFRIYPMFLLVFALYCALLLGLGLEAKRSAAFVANIPYFLLFFPEHSIFFNTTGVEVPFNMAWSIGIEEKFYIMWPLLAFGLLTHRRARRLPILLILLVAVTVISVTSFQWARAVAPYAHIVLGSIAAALLDSPRTYRAIRILGRRWVLAALVLLALTMQFGTAEILGGGRLYVAYGLVVTCCLIGLVTSGYREYNWLASRPMVYIGGLSYILYLIHNFGLNFAESIIPNSTSMPWSLASTALGISGSVVAAHFVHAWYEDPLRRLGVRISCRRQNRSHKAPATADRMQRIRYGKHRHARPRRNAEADAGPINDPGHLGDPLTKSP